MNNIKILVGEVLQLIVVSELLGILGISLKAGVYFFFH
jgi:hypothetical protein